MKDDSGRPGNGEKGLPAGTRARNRTMILGAERVGSIVGSGDRVAPAESQAHDLDPLGLDDFEQDEYVTPMKHDDDFQSLDEIFGAIQGSKEEAANHESSPSLEPVGVATKDASSTLMSDLGLDDDFQPALDVFDPPAEQPAPVAAPKIVRASSGILPTSPQIPVADVFDPFAAIDDVREELSSGGQYQTTTHELDPETAYGEASGAPSMVDDSSAAVSPPKVLWHGDIGAAATDLVRAPDSEDLVSPQPRMTNYELSTGAEYMTESRDEIYWKNESPLVGFLVSYDLDPKGSYVELRQGRLMVSNQREDSGSCLVILGESVSPMHAIMRVAAGGAVQVLDQLSESGTRVRHSGRGEEEFLSGEKSSLSHGDIVFFGDRKFHVLLVVGEGGED
jgi:hypothetical protein